MTVGVVARPVTGMAHRVAVLAATALVLHGCAEKPSAPGAVSPRVAIATIQSRIPSGTPDAKGWAADVYAAFAVQEIEPSLSNICAVVAVIGQESSFRVDPAVPNLPKTAWAEIDRRAEGAGVPAMVVHAALQIRSSNGASYADRIDAAKTEKQLSDVFEDLIGAVPLGSRLFDGLNPVHTRGPMQVQVAFAKRYVRKPYPYPVAKSLGDELFTRRGGVFFGIAHLLDYPAPYDKPLYRFADFNAGQYASRNAAFQAALTKVSGIPLAADGALVAHADDAQAGSTELAARVIARRIGLDDGDVRRALDRENTADFERTTLYGQVFTLADRFDGRPMARAVVPDISLAGPKITRHLTTAWYANSVDARYRRCLGR